MSGRLKVEGLELKAVKKGGETIMNKLILAIGLVVLVSGIAGALTTDSVLLTITPVFNLSVNISSTTNTFGSNIPLKSSVTICVGQITNDGDVSSKWQKGTESQTGTASGKTKWTLITGGTPGKDEFRLLAISTGTNTDPSFCGASAGVSAIKVSTDTVIGVTTSLTDLTEGGSSPDSPSHPVSETRRLWASVMMPSSLTYSGEQTITLTIQAVLP